MKKILVLFALVYSCTINISEYDILDAKITLEGGEYGLIPGESYSINPWFFAKKGSSAPREITNIEAGSLDIGFLNWPRFRNRGFSIQAPFAHELLDEDHFTLFFKVHGNPYPEQIYHFDILWSLGKRGIFSAPSGREGEDGRDGGHGQHGRTLTVQAVYYDVRGTNFEGSDPFILIHLIEADVYGILDPALGPFRIASLGGSGGNGGDGEDKTLGEGQSYVRGEDGGEGGNGGDGGTILFYYPKEQEGILNHFVFDVKAGKGGVGGQGGKGDKAEEAEGGWALLEVLTGIGSYNGSSGRDGQDGRSGRVERIPRELDQLFSSSSPYFQKERILP